MLVALELKDYAIVDSLRVEFTPGLNVLTGETGAGKSILVGALALLIGGRADSGMIRSGCDRALIQGFFNDSVTKIESASRKLQVGGRSSARIDGELVTISELANFGARLVALHGQHAAQTLLEANEQRKLLDRLLNSEMQSILAGYREGFVEYQRLKDELETLRAEARERARRRDMLDFQIAEIDGAKLRPEEEETLRQEAETLRHAERIIAAAGGALQLMSEEDRSAIALVAEAARQLEGAGRYSEPLATLACELQEALSSLQAISAELSDFLSDFEVTPGRLEKVEARLALIEKLKLKYGESVSAILGYREQADHERENLGHAEETMTELQDDIAKLEDRLIEQAANLSAARRHAAEHVAKEVSCHIRKLGMPNASFAVNITPLEKLGMHGKDRVTFLFSANLGEPLAPLSAVASGGELSRVMLGLNVVTGSDLPTLVFDEVDAGIGGQAARAVGATLKMLAQDRQVLVVTHLPQVAAFADSQFFVEKLERSGRTVTKVTRLDAKSREKELARMLSGAITETALAHARELLLESQGQAV